MSKDLFCHVIWTQKRFVTEGLCACIYDSKNSFCDFAKRNLSSNTLALRIHRYTYVLFPPPAMSSSRTSVVSQQNLKGIRTLNFKGSKCVMSKWNSWKSLRFGRCFIASCAVLINSSNTHLILLRFWWKNLHIIIAAVRWLKILDTSLMVRGAHSL